MFYTKKQRANLIAEKAQTDAELNGLAPGPAREVGHYARSLILAGESGWRAIMAAQDMVSWLSLIFVIEPMRRGEDLTSEEIEIAVLARASEYTQVRLGNKTWSASKCS